VKRQLSPALKAALLPGRVGMAAAHKLAAARVRPALVLRIGSAVPRPERLVFLSVGVLQPPVKTDGAP